jgi:outer membrane murein-binding lipoprotein Lpp
MSRPHSRTLLTATVLLSLLGGCVKKSEYDALQLENQTLQKRVDQTSHQLAQSQTDVSELQAQLHKVIVAQRRTAMVGKKYPMLTLEDGRVLRQAEIVSVNAEEISFRHAEGTAKVALARSTPDLRWEAGYDPMENKVKKWEREIRPVREQGLPQTAPTAATPARNAADVLRAQLAAQRQSLNSEYEALAAKNPAAMRGVQWDSTRPEASPLLNTLSGSRAVLGLSRLQTQRNTILATLQQLRDLDPSAR